MAIEQTIAERTIRPWQNLLGWTGALSLVVAYALLTFDVFGSDTLAYNLFNLYGGLALGYRVYLDRNWANLTLEVFFVSVALFALARILLF